MTQLATFANGCFWCTEAIFQRLKGVKSVKSGYSGGTTPSPNYENIGDHAEALQIEFDPDMISYGDLLEIFWHTHDPTTLNRQGNDVGTQYRSAIFYRDDIQKELAEKTKEELAKSGTYPDPIVTEIKPFTGFFTAEDYHQNFYNENQTYPYCTIIINPKIKKFLENYGDKVDERYKS